MRLFAVKEKNMCYKKRCDTCNKITFGGCGRHVEQVLADVPKDQRCQGHLEEEDTDPDPRLD